MSSSDSTTPTDPSKVFRGPRRTVVETLVAHGGSAPTPLLEESAVGPTGNIYYHLRKLREAGVIVQSGEERTERGQYANRYRLTDAGKTMLETVDKRGASVSTNAELEARIEKLEAENERLAKAVGELADDEPFP